MKKLLILFGFIVLAGCKSVELPKIEDSEKYVAETKPKIEQQDSQINSQFKNLPYGNDMILKMDMAGMNKIIQTVAYTRNDDMNLTFFQSKDLIKEEKSVLGIKYTNTVNVDSGFVSLNLKSFRFTKFESNKIYGILEIEGFGNVKVSGKYAGIPASVSPDIQLYLNEPIIFNITPTDTGYVVIKPEQQTLILKTKISIKLLQWSIPWYQEIPLELTNLLKPIALPIAMNAEAVFPMPEKTYTGKQLEYVPYWVELAQTYVYAYNNKIEYKTNINFKKK